MITLSGIAFSTIQIIVMKSIFEGSLWDALINSVYLFFYQNLVSNLQPLVCKLFIYYVCFRGTPIYRLKQIVNLRLIESNALYKNIGSVISNRIISALFSRHHSA